MAYTIAYDPERAAWVVLDFLGRKVRQTRTEQGARTMRRKMENHHPGRI